VRGELVHGDPNVEISGVVIDSRLVCGGELFVPIVAERDGHQFIGAAVHAGASLVLTSRRDLDTIASAIAVDDTSAALLDLGRYVRTRLPDRVVGITGSVGKTSVKDLTAAALRAGLGVDAVQASPRSFNNELGVPLTLANAPDEVEAVVVEMGARGRGHIAMLCDVAHPTIGIVTTVALAHAEMFGTIDEVAAAKGELVAALPSSGTAVLNGDHPLVAAMANRTAARVVTFGVDSPGIDVTASAISIDDELRASFRLHSPWGGADVRLAVRGVHQVMNALAAATGAMACGVEPELVASGLNTAVLSPWRMELERAASGALVLNDAYNANPTSMDAALGSLAALPAQRRIAVVGLMAELGPDGPRAHRRVAAHAATEGIELIAVDVDLYGVEPVAGVQGALRALAARGAPAAGDAILVKGSRVAGLERVATALLRPEGSPS
jgi:UDP-N-acetylmuramoyl-tripeptide--D-alanyl-D-alanine ligase